MPSTYTTNTGIEKIATGEQSGTWGNTTNTNLDLIDQSTNGIVEITVSSAATSGSPNSLPITNGALSNGRNVYIEFKDGGDLGGTVFYQLDPNDAEKVVHVRNNLTNQALILFQGTYNSSNDIEIPNGKDMVVKFDGAGSGATVEQIDKNLNPTTVEITGALTGTTATFTTADNTTQLKLVSTDTDASVGPKLDLHRNSANPAADDILGVIRFLGEDSNSNEQEYAKIRAHIIDPTSGSEDTKLVIQTQTGGAGFERLMFSPTETNFNDDGGAIDFRVESDNSTHMLFVDASADAIGIRKNDPSYGLDVGVPMRIITSNNSAQLVLECTDTDDLVGPDLKLDRNVTGADNDFLGRIDFRGGDNAGNLTQYCQIETEIRAADNGSEAGRLNFRVVSKDMTSGAPTKYQSMIGATGFGVAETCFNEDSNSIDFRVESDGNANAIFVDASTNEVILNGSSNGAAGSTTFASSTGNFRNVTPNATTADHLIGAISGVSNGFQIANDTSNNQDYKFFNGTGNSFQVGSSETVVNESSNDRDFRVESDDNANCFFLDAGNEGHIGINHNSPTRAIHTKSDDFSKCTILLERTGGGEHNDSGLQFQAAAGSNSGHGIGGIWFKNASDDTAYVLIRARTDNSSGTAGRLEFLTGSGSAVGNFTTPRMTLNNTGDLLIGRTSAGNTGNGHTIRGGDSAIFSRDATGESVQVGRNAADGQLIQFRDNGTEVGDIRVDGTTVSLTGFAGNHESSGISETTEVGTVVSTIDELDTRKLADGSVVDHKNHAKIKVSDSVGDKRVYGVLNKFVEHSSGVTKALVTSVGISSIKVTGACEGGDLLESNGDGTAKVQSDDIIRSKTIGKVTIGNSNTGVKLVSCVLYCG